VIALAFGFAGCSPTAAEPGATGGAAGAGAGGAPSGAGGSDGSAARVWRINDKTPLPSVRISPEALGKADLSGILFTAFSQGGTDATDPQVLDLAPDLLPRGWQRWRRQGLKAADYDFTYPARAREKGIRFVAGTTASVFFEDEISKEAFEALVTRDVSGKPVSHAIITPGAYRANLAHPDYRKHLIDISKLQIDGGVDGLFFDEINAGYTGEKFDGNEGFDELTIADFGQFLCEKYASDPQAFAARVALLPEDGWDCGLASKGRGLDYRGYLRRRGADKAPLGSNNLLATDWGRVTTNRPNPASGSFLDIYPPLVYWQEIVVAVRQYAREKYGKEILITANGIVPFADFQSVGLYEWNPDGPGELGFDWVPVKDGHFAGNVSAEAPLRKFRKESKELMESVGGSEVPVLVFLDWPTKTMDRYYELPASERLDYVRLRLAEAYALGLWFAVPLQTATDNNTATVLGTLPLIKQQRAFYDGHRELFQPVRELEAISVSSAEVRHTRTELADGRQVIHLLNHAYASGFLPQANVKLRLTRGKLEGRATAYSPDWSDQAGLELEATANGDEFELTLPKLTASAVVVVR
jgi:hypothetical protein